MQLVVHRALLLRLALLIVLGAVLTACQELPLPQTSSPTPLVPTETTAPGDSRPLRMIGVSMLVETNDGRPEVYAGEKASLRLDFIPSIMSLSYRADGSVISTNWKPWSTSAVAQMDLCFSADGPCKPAGKWVSFQSSSWFDYPVDWLGERTFYAAVQFRDAAGKILSTGKAYEYRAGPVAEVSIRVTSRVNETPGEGALSGPLLTAQAATRSAFPVTGSVVIEDGRCCAGGVAGSQVNLSVAFKASSPLGKVTEMRVSHAYGCKRDAPSLDAPWEAFAPAKTYTTTLAINWVGFYVNVQFRDEKGNLSLVYCDDISLEGSPKQ